MFIASALMLMLTAADQAPAQPTPAQTDAASLERIKRSVLTRPALDVPAEVQMLVPEKKTTPIFRVTVEEIVPPPPWEADDVVPLYVRTPRPAYHHEYLMQVTPEAFRSATLYPGVDILSAIEALFDAVPDELREAQARRKVRKELERFELFVPK